MACTARNEGAVDRPASQARLVAMGRCLAQAARDDPEACPKLLWRAAVGLSREDRRRLDQFGVRWGGRWPPALPGAPG